MPAMSKPRTGEYAYRWPARSHVVANRNVLKRLLVRYAEEAIGNGIGPAMTLFVHAAYRAIAVKNTLKRLALKKKRVTSPKHSPRRGAWRSSLRGAEAGVCGIAAPFERRSGLSPRHPPPRLWRVGRASGCSSAVCGRACLRPCTHNG